MSRCPEQRAPTHVASEVHGLSAVRLDLPIAAPDDMAREPAGTGCPSQEATPILGTETHR